jgi:hypothetical protein
VPLGTLDLLGLLGVLGMMVLLSRRIIKNLTQLARLEPPNVVKNPDGSEASGGRHA